MNQSINLTNDDQDFWHYISPPGVNELTSQVSKQSNQLLLYLLIFLNHIKTPHFPHGEHTSTRTPTNYVDI